MFSNAINRQKIQLKTQNPNPDLLSLLQSHHTILFYSCRPDASLTKPSSEALSLVRGLGIDVREIEVTSGSALETALQDYSGWQFFPQLYVVAEFIGGSLIMGEFFRSAEYERVLSRAGVGILASETNGWRTPQTPPLNAVWKLSPSTDESYIVVARANGSVEAIQTHDLSVCVRIFSHDGWVNSARSDLSGQYLFSGGSDARLKLWDKSSGTLTRSVVAHSRWINDIAVDPNGRYVASAGADHVIRFWVPSTLTLISEQQAHRSNIWCAISTGEALITGSEDGMVVITRSVDFVPDLHFRAHKNGVTGVSKAPSPAVFCTTGFDGMAYGWNMRGVLLFQYGGHSERVWCACPIDEYQAMGTACADGSVDIWDPITGRRIQRFSFDIGATALCYLRRRNALVVGLADGTLVWKLL